MVQYYLTVMLILLLTSISDKTYADCHFLRLNGYRLSQQPDFFHWGELSPLIGLEAGRFYNLSPSGMETTGISSEVVKDLQGELYYIPQHLIDEKNYFSLRMMVVELDKDNPNDTILPLREYPISLAPELFNLNTYRASVFFQPFGDNLTSPRNEQAYHFNILKNSEDCSLNTSQGRINDRRFRLENDLKRLMLRIKYYDHHPILIGGQEYQLYKLPTVQNHKLAEALKTASLYAAVNTSELLTLGMELEKLNKVKNFQIAWKEYIQLMQRLYQHHFTVNYTEEKIWKNIKVPSLGFHPKWKELTGNTAGLPPPERWKLTLPE